MPLTQVELDKMAAGGCGDPDCKDCGKPLDELYLHSVCCRKTTHHVYYVTATGCVHVECGKCRKPVAVIKVA